MNNLEAYRKTFDGMIPWTGFVPRGCIADFVGMIVDLRFQPLATLIPGFDPHAHGGKIESTVLPDLSKVQNSSEAEVWFEAVNWVVAAREARGRYVMITLGANFGAQAVGAYRALRILNPMPYKLVVVEPVPGNITWIEQHMRANGVDPEEQWIIPMAISDRTQPVYFPVGGPGVGSNNCYASNELAARRNYADAFIAGGKSEEALRNLLLHNTTGIIQNLVVGADFPAEIKLVSAVTLNEVLGPFEKVDYLESDIQQSEILVFPSFLDVLRKKVRRIHIGTHGADVHRSLHNIFVDRGWEIVFSYEPNARHESALGRFELNDGVLTVRNPDL